MPAASTGVLLAVAGALLLAAAFEPVGLWGLAPFGVAALLLSVRGRRASSAFAIGAIGGGTFFAVHVAWVTVYLGPAPLVGLAGLMALWFGLGGVATGFAWRLERSTGAASAATVVALAAVWTLRELLSSSVPWGGFPWGRLAHSQAASPIGDVIGWVGMNGLTFLVAAIGATIALVVVQAGRRLVDVTAVVATSTALVLLPVYPIEVDGTMRIGAVQGDSEAGLLAPYVPGQIVAEHAAATELLDGERLDLVLWPENAGEREPQDDPTTRSVLTAIERRFDAPIILGGITTEGEDVYNSLLLWDDGVQATYHKRHPVPFAEYLPSREVLAPVLDALGLLDLIPRDFSIDPTSVNAFDVGGTTVGLAICFDVVDDGLLREQVLDYGARVLLTPSNNADFGEGSAQNVQQLSIARLRAMESGRAQVTVSTVGTSAIILPDGTVVDRLPQYEPGAMVETVPLSSTITLGVAAGRGIELAIAGLAVLGALAGALTRTTPPLRAPASPTRTSPAARSTRASRRR